MLDPTDWRLSNSGRFSQENFEKNAEMALKFAEYAKSKGCTGAQLSLAWLLSKGPDVFPIPGTRNPIRLEENVGCMNVSLSEHEIKEIEDIRILFVKDLERDI